jgi:hypothetical protein
MAEVAQQPPEAGRPAGAAVVVCDDEDAGPDSRARGRRRERLRGGQRMPALPARLEIGQLVDAEERGAGNVRLEIALAPGLDARQVVSAVDEPILDQ